MAWAPVERWLDKGWSLPRAVGAVIAGIATAVSVFGWVTRPGHIGAVWWVVIGLTVVLVYAVTEIIRWRWRHNRLEQELAHNRLEGIEEPFSTSEHPTTVAEVARSHGVDNVFVDEPNLADESGTAPYVPAAEPKRSWKPTPPPDFHVEFRRAAEIDRGYDGTEGAITAVEEWTQGVYAKLDDWMPRHADTFDRWSMNDIAVSVRPSITGEHFVDEHHRDLATRVERLRRILEIDSK